MVGTSVANISRIEKLDQPYTQDLLELIADALMVDPATLIMRDPSQGRGMWSLWDHATPAQRAKFEAMAEIILRDGTDG